MPKEHATGRRRRRRTTTDHDAPKRRTLISIGTRRPFEYFIGVDVQKFEAVLGQVVRAARSTH